MPETTHNGGTPPISVETGFRPDTQRLPTSTPEKTPPPRDVPKSNGEAGLPSPTLLHGGRSVQRHGIVLAQLGKRYEGIYGHIKHFRRVLEGHVREKKGEVSLRDGLIVNEACRWEMVARISQKLINDDASGKGAPTLPVKDIMLCLGRIADSTRNRNSSVAKLGLDAKGGDGQLDDPIALYAEPQDQQASTTE